MAEMAVAAEDGSSPGFPAIPFEDPRFFLLLDHWKSIRRGDRLPPRTRIDPVAFGSLLPMIWMVDFVPSIGSFRYRLSGEKINATFGFSLAGRTMRDVVGPSKIDMVDQSFRRVIEEPCILRVFGPMYRCTNRYLSGERLVLPLASDGARGDAIIGLTISRWSVLDGAIDGIETTQSRTFYPIP